MNTADSQEIKLEWAPTAGIMFLLLLLIGTLAITYLVARKLWPNLCRFLQRRGVGNAAVLQTGTFSATVGSSLLVAFGVLQDGWPIAGMLAGTATLLGIFAGSQSVEEIEGSRVDISNDLVWLLTLSAGGLGLLGWFANLPGYLTPWLIFLIMDGLGYTMAVSSISKIEKTAKGQDVAARQIPGR